MAEKEGPWWTRPPAPSRPSAVPSGGGQEQGEGGNGTGRAARRTAGDEPATPPMSIPAPTPGELPDVLDLRDRPRRSRRAERANRGAGTAGGVGGSQDAYAPGGDLGANSFGVDSYSTDPFSAGHVDADDALDPGAPTEQLPPVPDGTAARSGDQGYDALGVYGTPTAVAPGIPGLSADADPVDHLRDPAAGPRFRVPEVPWRELPKRIPMDRIRQIKWREIPWQRVRWKPIVAGAVVLFIMVTLVRLVVDDGDPASQASQNASGAGASSEGSDKPKGLARVEAAAAEKDLREVGQSRGDVQDAWGWTDENGRNLFATTRERVGNNVTLRVVHAAELDGDPRALRVMTDPSLPGCRGEGTAGFVKGSMQVRDLDRNGVAEATVGWMARCGAKSEESRVKLALLSDGKKYIIRGEGVIGDTGTRVPDPDSDQWPKGYLNAATELFEKLYF